MFSNIGCAVMCWGRTRNPHAAVSGLRQSQGGGGGKMADRCQDSVNETKSPESLKQHQHASHLGTSSSRSCGRIHVERHQEMSLLASGRPHRVGPPPLPPWGPGGDRLGWGHIRILHKAPKDYTKPQQTIQSPDRPYKAPEHYTKT